ncbi:hypothetical protein SPURM210S_03084 [Streptomyces purpurascens]
MLAGNQRQADGSGHVKRAPSRGSRTHRGGALTWEPVAAYGLRPTVYGKVSFQLLM